MKTSLSTLKTKLQVKHRKKIILALAVISLILLSMGGVFADTSGDYSLIWNEAVTGDNSYIGATMDDNGNVYTGSLSSDNVYRISGTDGSTSWTYDDTPTIMGVRQSIEFGGGSIYVIERQSVDPGGDPIYVTEINTNDGSLESRNTIFNSNAITTVDEISLSGDYLNILFEEQGEQRIWNINSQSQVLSYQGDDSWTIDQDSDGNWYHVRGGGGLTVQKKDDTGATIWSSGGGFLQDGAESIVTNGSGQNADVYVGSHNGWATGISQSGNAFAGQKWETQLGSSSLISASFDQENGVVGFGSEDGTIYILNESDGSQVDSFAFADNSNVNGLELSNGKLVAVQNDGSKQYWQLGSSPNFDVSIFSTNSPITESETLEVTVNVSNTGTETGTQDVNLSIDGNEVDSQSVNLAGNSDTSITLEWVTQEGDTGTHTALVQSENDSDSTSIDVNDATNANFLVNIQSTNSPVGQTETLNVQVNVTNTGDLNGTLPVNLSIDGSEEDSQDVNVNGTLHGNNEEIITLNWDVDLSAGTYTALVQSPNNSDSQQIEVVTVPESIDLQLDTTGTVTGGENVSYSVILTNTDGSTEDVTNDLNNLTVSQGTLTVNQTASHIVTENCTSGQFNVNAEWSGVSPALTDSETLSVDSQTSYNCWTSLNGGQMMIVLFSDWTILAILAALLISVLMVGYSASPIAGVLTFSMLIIFEWVVGLVPDYVALGLLIFIVAMGFVSQNLMEGRAEPRQARR